MLLYGSNTAVMCAKLRYIALRRCWGNKMLTEFRAFIVKGNVLDLAVAVIIGAAFAKIANGITEDLIVPMVGGIFGGMDFWSHFVLLGAVPASYHGSMRDYAAL